MVTRIAVTAHRPNRPDEPAAVSETRILSDRKAEISRLSLLSLHLGFNRRSLIFTLATVVVMILGAGWGLENPLRGQSTGESAEPAKTRLIGEVTAIDTDTNRLTLKTDDGKTSTATLSSTTRCLLVPPGETSLKNATRIEIAEIAVGDRVLAQGLPGENQNSLTAELVVVMSRTALAQKREKEQEDWKTRGLFGRVSATDAAAKEITLAVWSLQGTKTVVIESADTARILRYAPDSIRYSDATSSSVSDIKVGDQLNVLRKEGTDDSRIQAEVILAGSFRTFAATVSSVDTAAGMVKVKDLETKKSVRVRINENCAFHRLPENMARMLEFRLRGESAGRPGGRGGFPGGRAGPGGPSRGGQSRREGRSPRQGREAGQGPRRGGGPGQGGFGRSGPALDFQQILARSPRIQLEDLKTGEAIVISSTTPTDGDPVTAFTVVAGVEPLLSVAPQAINSLGAWNLGGNIPE